MVAVIGTLLQQLAAADYQPPFLSTAKAGFLNATLSSMRISEIVPESHPNP